MEFIWSYLQQDVPIPTFILRMLADTDTRDRYSKQKGMNFIAKIANKITTRITILISKLKLIQSVKKFPI